MAAPCCAALHNGHLRLVPAASISQITDLFQLAQVRKCRESPEYAPAPQRMSIKKKRGDRTRCYRVKELSGLAFSTSPRLRSKKTDTHLGTDACIRKSL